MKDFWLVADWVEISFMENSIWVSICLKLLIHWLV
jgi:hypothetical protein